MKKIFLLTSILLLALNASANWNDLNTGINDNLTGAVFWGDNGVVSGNKGLYYTTNGGNGPGNWTRYNILGNQSDSIIYNNTQFTHCYSANLDYVFACGQDTVNNKAVIFQFSFATLTHSLLFEGVVNSKLNNISYSTGNHYLAVGEDELVVQFSMDVNGTILNSNGTLNFLSIDNWGSKFTIVGDEYIIEGIDNNPGITLITFNEPNLQLKDIYKTGSYYGTATGNDIIFINSFTNTTSSGLSTGVSFIGANALIIDNNYILLGTNQGIYRRSSDYNPEWQPTSFQYKINDFWKQNGQSKIYAVGDNGVLLYTTDNGGTPVPSIRFNGFGKCVGQSPYITHNDGSGNSCEWYQNGVLTSNQCWTNGYNFSSIGDFDLKLIVSNSVGVDSAEITISVVDTPSVEINYTVNDTILCHQEMIEIEFDSSQYFVNYELHSLETNQTFGESPIGNEDTLVYTTFLLSQSGNYKLRAKSTLAVCNIDFVDTIKLTVEQTTANFHSGTLNVIPGESVKFYENCTDASNYLWGFTPNASFSTLNGPEISNSFTMPGTFLIELICWSDNACYDTIQKNGPTVYTVPSNIDSCWVNLSNGSDPNWPGYYNPHINSITETSNGYLISGKRYNETFATQNGDSLYLNDFGGYLNQYDYNGVLKWSIKSIDANSSSVSINHEKISIKSSAIDSYGNIYACGYFREYYIDNRGDTINLPVGNGIIFKLDSLGKTIWHRSCSSLVPIEVAIDGLDNVYVSYSGGSATKTLYFNQFPTDTIIGEADVNYGIIKLDQNGSYIWDVPIKINAINNSGIVEMQFDNDNNVYVASIMELNITIYSVNNPGGTFVPGITSNYGGKTLIFKLNENGEIQWTLRSRTIGVPNDSTYPMDMVSDNVGNLYISGRNNRNVEYASIQHIFENTDGSITSSDVGEFFIAKVNSSGVCQWIRGGNTSYYGFGERVDLVNDTVYVIGRLSQNNQIETTVEFRNPDGTLIPLTIDQYHHFIAVYDTTGNIIKIIKNGENSNVTYFSYYGEFGFFKRNNGSYYISTNGVRLNYQDFGQPITETNGREGWVTKAEEGCGIIIPPVYLSHTDTTLCQGSDYTLVNGTVLSNIQTSLVDTVMFTSLVGVDSLIITNITILPTYTINDTFNVCTGSIFNFPDGTNITNILTDTTQISLMQTYLGCDSLISTTLNVLPDYIVYDTIYPCVNDSYTFIDGSLNSSLTDTLTHISQLQTIYGCDSLFSETLIPIIIDNSIFIQNYTLVANQPQTSEINYQWIDCDNNYSYIAGETQQTYALSTDGNYAVQISSGNCIVVSDCILINFMTIEDISSNIRFYPNPVTNVLNIEILTESNCQIRIYNINGEMVYNREGAEVQTQINTSNFAPGMYNVSIFGDDLVYYFSFIK